MCSRPPSDSPTNNLLLAFVARPIVASGEGGSALVVASTVCAGSPIPFDPTEVDRKLAAEHTLGGLAETANRVVFDLFDHCALVVRFFVVERGSGPRLVKTSGDRRLVPNRVALRARALK